MTTTMLVRQWKAWPANAIIPDNAHPVDVTRSWVHSPQFQSVALPPIDAPIGETLESKTRDLKILRYRKRSGKRDDPSRNKASRLSLFFWRDLLGLIKRKREAAHLPPVGVPQALATTADWRAYGHWARPVVNGVIVRNATPPPVPRKLEIAQVEAVMQNLVDISGVPHPENWIAGAGHPSIPPQPSLWRHPLHRDPPLSPNELQLNPFLEHRRYGMTPMQYDLRWFHFDDPLVVLGEMPPNGDTSLYPELVYFSLQGPNGAQPATYPGASSMKITMLADDTLSVFPWPFIVHAHHETLPVMVHDVLNAVTDNFKERLTTEEVDSVNRGRKDVMYQAYWARTRAAEIADETVDGLRRVDYLGTNYMFRGLKPAPDGEGFTLFVGSP